MKTLDLKKDLKYLYQPTAKVVTVVDVPRFQFIMIDGAIEPGLGPGSSPAFKEAMEAMYSAAYTLKFMSKLRKDDPIDYPVMAMEGLWWLRDGDFSIYRKDNWDFRLMILQPDHITPEMFADGLEQIRRKKGDLAALPRLRLEFFEEGCCVQIMHIGPYDTEPATVEKMETFCREKGYKFKNLHHEIYLGNPMKAAPEKLKTVLRHPISV
jgi:hypothetical protein